ncbi:MAG TPA: tetratricopeptide repeat protein [Flavihumibacter sp.]
MSKTVCWLLFVLAGLIPIRLIAQRNKVDSLQALLATARDTNRVNLLNQLASSYWYTDPAQTIRYADEAIDEAEKNDFAKGRTAAYNNKGVGFYQQNNYAEAMIWFNKALEGHRAGGNYQGEAYLLNNIGMMYWKQSKLDTALQYYLQSMKIWEEHYEPTEIASLLQNIGNLYNDQDDMDRALEYYFRALELEKKHQAAPRVISMTLSNIGTAYLSQSRNEEALKYFRESLEYLQPEDMESRAISLSNIGLTLIELKNYKEAQRYLDEARQLQDQTGDDDGKISTLLGLAQIKQVEGNLKEADRLARQALDLALAIDLRVSLIDVWKLLASIAEQRGDYKQAHEYFKSYTHIRDSLQASENIFKIAHMQAAYHADKKLVLMQQENAQQAFRRNTLIAGLIALLVIAALVVSRQRLKLRQNRELITINEQLTRQSEQLAAQAEKLKELDQVKTNFFANISHEFRTPLTLILNGLTDRLAEMKTREHIAADTTENKEQLEVMYRNAKRLLSLINQLLDLSKLEAGQMKLQPRNGELVQLLKLVFASFSSYGSSRQLEFNLKLPEAPLYCRLDIDKVEKILYNLLSNALKFTPMGGAVTLTGELFESADGKMIRLMVEDNGKGIAPDQLPHVFDRFYQGNQYYSDAQGTGIGLSLTRELVELHGGKISVSSDQDKGTCFEVLLPLVPPVEGEPFNEYTDLPAEVMTVNDGSPESLGIDGQSAVLGETRVALSKMVPGTEEGAGSELNTGGANPDQPRVLVVEDNEDLRNYLRKHLEAQYLVIEAEHGRLGFEKAVEQVPDLIISDWMMPEMDGIELCKSLKNDERTSHIPVIILTAVAGNESKLMGLETGADDYLTKPFDNRELQIRIRNLVETRRQLREKYSRQVLLGPKKTAVKSMDEKFLDKVMEAIEANMGDPDFSMDRLGQEVSLSRMQLHRKLKALTGESPGRFFEKDALEKSTPVARIAQR